LINGRHFQKELQIAQGNIIKTKIKSQQKNGICQII